MKLFSKNVLVLAAFLISSAAIASGTTVSTLNDLPSSWKGEAGDLFNKSTASLIIEEIKLLSGTEKEGSLYARYSVKSLLKIGSRKLNIHEIHLSSANNDLFEVSLLSEDKLVPNLFAIIKRDEKSGKFSLREMPKKGWERRFVLEESN